MAYNRYQTPYPPYAYRPYYYYGPYYGTMQRSDAEIQEDVKAAMRYDSWVDANQVNVDVNDGVVTLTGTVDSWREKRAAGDDAWDTLGVVDVNNDLQVKR